MDTDSWDCKNKDYAMKRECGSSDITCRSKKKKVEQKQGEKMVSEIKAMLMQGAMCHTVAGKTWHSQTTEERQNCITLLAKHACAEVEFSRYGKTVGSCTKPHNKCQMPPAPNSELPQRWGRFFTAFTLWLLYDFMADALKRKWRGWSFPLKSVSEAHILQPHHYF